MFSLIAIYLVCGLSIWWCYSGYVYYLFLYNLFRRLRRPSLVSADSLRVGVVVPTFNEASLIDEKLASLLALDYPADKVAITVVDGGSTDGTAEAVRLFAQKHPGRSITLLDSPVRGRSPQINHALRQAARPDIWVLTDADSLMSEPSLKAIVAMFEHDPRVGVVGAFIEPKESIALEHKYWQYQNILRWLESNIDSTSIVVGPCYAFRSEIIASVPDDCSSDDVYVCFAANAKGRCAKYIIEARATETRTPQTLLEYLNHKFRKGNAYIIELLRFLYLVPTYAIRWKIVFLTKVLQILAMPFVMVLFLLIAINLSFVSVGYLVAVAASWLFLLVNVLVTSLLIGGYYKSHCKESVTGGMVGSFVFTNFVLFWAVLTYLVHFQDDRPDKIGKP